MTSAIIIFLCIAICTPDAFSIGVRYSTVRIPKIIAVSVQRRKERVLGIADQTAIQLNKFIDK